MPALTRLRQHWVEDPTSEGGDSYRIFLSNNRRKLHTAVRALDRAYEEWNGGEGPDELIDSAEANIVLVAGVSSIEHDWKHWDWENDVPTLAELGITLTVTELPRAMFRVCLTRTPRLPRPRTPRSTGKARKH